MDQVSATAAAMPASSQVDTDSYRFMGRQQAQFWSKQAEVAKAQGTDNTSLGFKDLVDLVNPLQHLPVVGGLYRAVTGDDTIKPAVKITGDIAYGGPIAGMVSIFDTIFKESSGKDVTSTLASWAGLGGGDSQTQIAAAAPAPAPIITDAASASTATVAANNNSAAAAPSAATSAQPAVNPAAQNSSFFAGLQKGAAPEGQVINTAQTQKFFNPNTQKFAGMKPSALQLASNTTAPIAVTPVAAQAVADSNAAIAGSNATTDAATDTAQNPQSEFAQKMMAALDRYEAGKQAGNAAAPAVNAGL